ncbi:MAG: hypothetical protein ACFCU3_04985 [Verrucomicrobiales bacterium]
MKTLLSLIVVLGGITFTTTSCVTPAPEPAIIFVEVEPTPRPRPRPTPRPDRPEDFRAIERPATYSR